MSRSVDDNIFAFTVKNSSYNTVGFIVYRRSTNEILYSRTTSLLDEVQIDKSGRYLVYKTGEQGAGKMEVEIIDLLDNSVVQLTDDSPDFAPGHSDNGNGMVIGADNWRNQVTFRNLATPHILKTVFDFGNMWDVGGGYHVSQLADNERWTLLSFYSNSTSDLFRRELVQIATDGSQRVRRFAHHRSMSSAYYNTPRANISRDGNFVAFTSDWGGRSRTDLFIAKVPLESANTLTSVTWQNIQNTIINGATVEHSQAGYYAVAKSQETLSGAGSFEFVYDGKRYSAGLGKSGGYSNLDFQLSFFGTYADIRQGGIYVGEMTGLSAGSVINIKIAVNGDLVFSKNNVVVKTISNPSKSYPYPLVFNASNDAPLGQSIINAKVQ